MQVGIHITGFSWPDGAAGIGPTLAETARAAEDAGIASISVMDHFLQLGGPSAPPTSRCWRATPPSATSPATPAPPACTCWSPE